MRPPISHGRGFTLIEAIMVIVITGVIASMVAVFVKTGVDSYFDSTRRAQLTDTADVALRRLAREVRLAVPNSLRVAHTGGSYYIEFVPSKSGGRYRNEGDGSDGGNFLCSSGSVNTTFDVLGAMPDASANDFVAIFNDASLGASGSPCNVYCGGSRATINSVGASSLTTSAAFANSSVICSYANNRFQIIAQNTRAVTYACPDATAGNMNRYANYGFNATQATPPVGTPALVVQNATCVVDYTQNIQQRNGLLYISLTLTDGTASTEQIVVFRQIHVDNSP